MAKAKVQGARYGRPRPAARDRSRSRREDRHSYVRHHQIAADQLAGLIAGVHRALASSLARAAAVRELLQPAVPIRRSVQQGYVVCLECGFRALMLRRQLRVVHDLEVADYRARWKLPPDHPIIGGSIDR
jgi:predicted transcriptional regulator